MSNLEIRKAKCPYRYKDPKTGEIKELDLSCAETITISRDVLQMMYNILEPEQIGNVFTDVIKELYYCDNGKDNATTKPEVSFVEQVMDNVARFHNNKLNQQKGLKQNQ